MKKLIISTITLPILAFSYEVNLNKSFTKSVKADVLSTNITFTVEKQDEKSINIEIEKFNNLLKNKKNITIKNTNYNLIPKYEYIENKQHFRGYIGETRFYVSSKNDKAVNKFINEIINYKNKNDSNDLKVNISNLSWDFSNKLKENMTNELRVESLIWITEYSKDLSKKLSKKCELKSVNIFEEAFFPMARTKMYSSPIMLSDNEDMNISNITPLNNEQDIKVDSNFTMECK